MKNPSSVSCTGKTNTVDINTRNIKAEKERKAREAKEAWIKKLEEKKQACSPGLAVSKPVDYIPVARKEPEPPNPEPGIHSTWHISNYGTLHTGPHCPAANSPGYGKTNVAMSTQKSPASKSGALPFICVNH